MSGSPFARFRRDANEAEAVTHLRAHGYVIKHIHGDGVPDLLCWSGRGRRIHLVEVKGPKGVLTEAQERFFAVLQHEQAPLHVVRTGAAAVAMIRSYDEANKGDP